MESAVTNNFGSASARETTGLSSPSRPATSTDGAPDPQADAAEVLLASERAVAVLDLTPTGPALRWANAAFERITGHTMREAREHGKLISPGYRSVVLAEIAE